MISGTMEIDFDFRRPTQLWDVRNLFSPKFQIEELKEKKNFKFDC